MYIYVQSHRNINALILEIYVSLFQSAIVVSKSSIKLRISQDDLRESPFNMLPSFCMQAWDWKKGLAGWLQGRRALWQAAVIITPGGGGGEEGREAAQFLERPAGKPLGQSLAAWYEMRCAVWNVDSKRLFYTHTVVWNEMCSMECGQQASILYTHTHTLWYGMRYAVVNVNLFYTCTHSFSHKCPAKPHLLPKGIPLPAPPDQ